MPLNQTKTYQEQWTIGMNGKRVKGIHWYQHNLIIYTSKLLTIVKGNQKAPFSIATTLRGRRKRYSFPWITPLYR